MNATLSRTARMPLAATDTVLELQAMLDLNQELRAHDNGEGKNYLAASDANVRVLLDAITSARSPKACFSMKLASVGNPDFGQYHDEGVASPSLVIQTDSFETLVRTHNAYISVFELGGGNMARGSGDIYRGDVLVARISYNGRLWTPEDFPRCRELDPKTGNEIPRQAKGGAS